MFITFEGIEGCGKTTQVKRFTKYLNENGIHNINTLEPGGTAIGQNIRRILLDTNNTNLFPLTELILYAADRAQHVNEVIKPGLDQGKWVICDRYLDATIAYQGFGRGLNMEIINILNNEATRGLSPDITILMDCPEEIGINRALARNKDSSQEDQGRFEKEKMEFHHRVRKGYLTLAEENKDRYIVIDAAKPIDEVERDIIKSLKPYIDFERKRVEKE
ncbi:dTMP kinase [Thermodesulfobacteriota bacterium]